MDTLLYQTYCASVGEDKVGNDVKHTGKNGRVELTFNSDSGHSTSVDLGGSLEVGYVVQQIDDGLGLFPEGTEVGDLINNDVIQEIIRSQAERDKGGDIMSSVVNKYDTSVLDAASSSAYQQLIRSNSEFFKIFSVAKLKDPSRVVPQYLLNLFHPNFIDSWVGDYDSVEAKKFSACVTTMDEDQTFYFDFRRDLGNKSLAESPSGNVFKFCSVHLNEGGKWYKREGLTQDDFNSCYKLIEGNTDNIVEVLGMSPVSYVLKPYHNVCS